jgi:hypothetical protein
LFLKTYSNIYVYCKSLLKKSPKIRKHANQGNSETSFNLHKNGYYQRDIIPHLAKIRIKGRILFS